MSISYKGKYGVCLRENLSNLLKEYDVIYHVLKVSSSSTFYTFMIAKITSNVLRKHLNPKNGNEKKRSYIKKNTVGVAISYYRKVSMFSAPENERRMCYLKGTHAIPISNEAVTG